MSDLGNACLSAWPLYIILIGLLIWLIKAHNRGLRQLAHRLGFRYRDGFATGEYRGRLLKLGFKRKGRYYHDDFTSTDETKIYTRIITNIENQKDYNLLIKPTGLIRKVTSSLGIRAVDTGHEIFDKRYSIKSQPEDFAKRLSEITFFSQILHAHPSLIRVQRNQFIFEKEGFNWEDSRESFFRLFDLLCDVVEKIETLTKIE